MKDGRFVGQLARWCLFGLAIGVGAAGCEKKPKNQILTLKGRVEKINRTSDTTGEITVRFFNEKQNQELSGTALITPQTRIEKAGAPGTLADLQEGTPVEGEVRVEKEGGQKKYTAVLIKISEAAPARGS